MPFNIAVTRFAMIVGTAAAVASAPTGAQTLQPSGETMGQIRTGGVRLQEPPERPEEQRKHGPTVPFPNSTKPSEVTENIHAIAQQTKFVESSGIVELATPGAFRIQRVLDVKSELFGRYLVVELDDAHGAPLAKFAMRPSGDPIVLENHKGRPRGGSLDLGAARSAVASLGKASGKAEYVYFHNVAERGISICRPLTAVSTPEGMVYLNSSGEAFVERDTPIARQMTHASQAAISDVPGLLPLVAVTKR